MTYCRNLDFTQEPNYRYLSSLLLRLANKEGLNLKNGSYDWCVKASAIQRCPSYFDWMSHQDVNPFDKKGKFQIKYREYGADKLAQEKKIYEGAETFKF